MKRFKILAGLFAVIAMSFAAPAQSQTISLYIGSPYGNGALCNLVAGDTLVNTDTVFKVINTSAGYKDLGFQCLIKKLSGTTLTGKMIIWGSNDGINYVATDSATYAITSPSTLITPTFDYSAVISKTGSPFVWYAVLVTNSAGSATGQVRVRFTTRRQQSTIAY